MLLSFFPFLNQLALIKASSNLVVYSTRPLTYFLRCHWYCSVVVHLHDRPMAAFAVGIAFSRWSCRWKQVSLVHRRCHAAHGRDPSLREIVSSTSKVNRTRNNDVHNTSKEMRHIGGMWTEQWKRSWFQASSNWRMAEDRGFVSSSSASSYVCQMFIE